MSTYIKIEPHEHYRYAIQKKTSAGYVTYNYWQLIKVCAKHNKWNQEEARDWVEYNIASLSDETTFALSFARRFKVGKVGRRKR